jgi:hypothetical protein
MLACEACGTPISAQAPQCPRCGHPNRRAPPSELAASTNSALRSIAAVCTLAVAVALAWGLYGYFLTPETKNSVNRIASATGLSVVPWAERARTAATTMYERNGATLAQSIIGHVHPTGKSALLSNYSATIEGDDLVSRFDVRWKGGFLGSDYVTTVEWRCSQTSSGSARIVSDTAVIPVAASNAKDLEVYFAGSPYSALKSNAN